MAQGLRIECGENNDENGESDRTQEPCEDLQSPRVLDKAGIQRWLGLNRLIADYFISLRQGYAGVAVARIGVLKFNPACAGICLVDSYVLRGKRR